MDDNTYQQLMTSLAAADGDLNTETILPDLLLQNMSDADPRLKAIATYLIRRQTEDSDSEDLDDNERLTSEEPAIAEGMEERDLLRRRESYNRLQQVTTEMYAELEDLRARNDALAAALGACYLCWGEDFECEECRGQGQPGAFTLDKELFGQYVAPAVQSVKTRQQVRHVRKEGPPHG